MKFKSERPQSMIHCRTWIVIILFILIGKVSNAQIAEVLPINVSTTYEFKLDNFRVLKVNDKSYKTENFDVPDEKFLGVLVFGIHQFEVHVFDKASLKEVYTYYSGMKPRYPGFRLKKKNNYTLEYSYEHNGLEFNVSLSYFGNKYAKTRDILAGVSVGKIGEEKLTFSALGTTPL